MRTTQQFSITLPLEMADTVKARVSSGEYATESEVIREGLRMLSERDKAMEAWFRQLVQESLDDPRPSVEHDEAQRYFAAKKAALRKGI